MSIIDRINSIAKKLGVTISGETIIELLASLENAIDRRDKTVSNNTNNVRMEKKFEFKKNNKNFNKNETKDDE